MKVQYTGSSFGTVGLTDGVVYTCLSIESGGDLGLMLRVVDDSGEDYLYSASNPAPLDGSSPGGRWKVVEDDASGSLAKAIPN